MKKLVSLLALAVVAAPAMAKEFVSYTGDYPVSGGVRASDIELEYDGELFYAYGTSPGWTDNSVVNFEIPAGGPFLVSEVRYYIIGLTDKPAEFRDGGFLSDPPSDLLLSGPSFNSGQSTFPPADWTTVDVTGHGLTVNTGDIVRPGLAFYGDGDGIGLAYAFDDGNPGHSWALYSGSWTDDTYGYDTDDGIRLGINYGGGTPTDETTWGAVKNMFAR